MNARQPLGLQATHPLSIARAAELHADRTLNAHLDVQFPADPSDDEFPTFTLPLGLTEVEVGYEVCAGVVFVQGIALNGEWVDIDNFAKSVRDGWKAAIERKLEGGAL